MSERYDVKADRNRNTLSGTVVAMAGSYEIRSETGELRGRFTGADSLAVHLAFALEEIDRLQAALDKVPKTMAN